MLYLRSSWNVYGRWCSPPSRQYTTVNWCAPNFTPSAHNSTPKISPCLYLCSSPSQTLTILHIAYLPGWLLPTHSTVVKVMPLEHSFRLVLVVCLFCFAFRSYLPSCIWSPEIPRVQHKAHNVCRRLFCFIATKNDEWALRIFLSTVKEKCAWVTTRRYGTRLFGVFNRVLKFVQFEKKRWSTVKGFRIGVF